MCNTQNFQDITESYNITGEMLVFLLRGDFLEYRAICAQKYRHALRENEAFCCFCQNGGVENSFDEFYAKLWSQKMLDRKKKTRNKLSITFSVY